MSFPRLFRLPLRPTILVLAFLLLTVNLGFWQLRREAQKTLWLEQMASAQAQPPISLSDALASAAPSARRVWVEGTWQVQPVILLENQNREGRFGVHVLQWLLLESGSRLLVDRGWQAEPVLELPLVSADKVSLHGQLYQPGAPLLRPVLDLSQRIVRTPVLDLSVFANGAPAASMLLRLDADSAEALLPNWQQSGMTPAKHRGYAVTWFSLSTVLLLLYLWWLYTVANAAVKNKVTDQPS